MVKSKKLSKMYKSPKNQKILDEKLRIAKKHFNLKCFIKNHGVRKGFLFHHREYKDGEKTYRDFPDTFQYNAYVIPIVDREPNRFFLLCRKHHHAVEKAVKYDDLTWTQLSLVRKLTKS